jgi:hypothetical protein
MPPGEREDGSTCFRISFKIMQHVGSKHGNVNAMNKNLVEDIVKEHDF